jgi:hypothetical protein
MFADNEADSIIKTILDKLGIHKETSSHAKHISVETCKEIGLKVKFLEKDRELQDSVLTVHHCFMHTFSNTPAIKIIENHEGKAIVIFHQGK